MSKPAKTFYILHGDDDFTIEREADVFRAKMNETPNGDLNTSEFDGEGANIHEILNAARSYPFLAERRLVLVKDLLAWVTRKGAGETGKKAVAQLIEELPQLPEWARVVFIERVELGESNKLVKLAQESPFGYEKCFKRPEDLTGWILRHAQDAYQTTIEPNAAAVLSTVCAGDLRRADNELLKLVSYVDGGRGITEADVNELTAMVAEAEIFKMVDSLAEGRPDVALKMLHGLLDEKDEDPFRIFGMIVRQFRLLLTAKEYISATGSANGMNTALGMAPFVAKKLTAQARGFSLEALDETYRVLAETDFQIKTGITKPEMALELFIAQVG